MILLTRPEAAARVGLCAKSLANYERAGRIRPRRIGANRLYTLRDLAALRAIKGKLAARRNRAGAAALKRARKTKH